MGKLACQNRSNTSRYPCSLPTGSVSLQRLDTLATLLGRLPLLPDSFNFLELALPHPVVVLGLKGPGAKDLGAFSDVEHAKIIWPLPCENVVKATCFVCISVLTDTSFKCT